MRIGDRYYELSLLGRETFLESVAMGALVLENSDLNNDEASRGGNLTSAAGSGEIPAFKSSSVRMARGSLAPEGDPTLVADSPSTEERPLKPSRFPSANDIPSLAFSPNLEILPLAKKVGTPFVDLITLGRTSNNDITLDHPSVSRFQAFFRQRRGRWFLCDAGSSNGTCIHRVKLKPRTEAEVTSGCRIHFGSVEATFYMADSLYDLLTRRP